MRSQDSVKLVCLTDVYSQEEDLLPIINRIGYFKFHKESTESEC